MRNAETKENSQRTLTNSTVGVSLVKDLTYFSRATDSILCHTYGKGP